MANINQFVFFDTSSTSTISNPYGNSQTGSAMTLQVDDLGSAASINLQVEGLVDLNEPDNYFPLKVVSLENFRSVKKIEKAGIYMVIIDGIAKVRIQSNAGVGNFKAYAVSIT